VTDLNRLLQRLCDAEIEFVIVGGFAAMLHGSTLLTRDLDVCALLSSANVEKLREILRDLHPTHRLTPQRLSFLDNPSPDAPVRARKGPAIRKGIACPHREEIPVTCTA
jgi:hypothetical protein